MFTEKELKVKEFIEKIYVPRIHQIMREGNPMHYVRYNGRCCRQIAYLLKLYLDEALPEYEWEAWESLFTNYFEDYYHAWVFGRSKDSSRPHIIMDYGKLENEYSFFLQTDKNEYPETIIWNGQELLLDDEIDRDERKRLMFTNEKETFTQKTFGELFLQLKEELQF